MLKQYQTLTQLGYFEMFCPDNHKITKLMGHYIFLCNVYFTFL